MAKNGTMAIIMGESNPGEDSMARGELRTLTINSGSSAADQEMGIKDENSFHLDDNDNESASIQNSVSEQQDETTISELLPRLFRRPCSTEHEHSTDYSDKATSYTYPTLEEFQKIGAIMNMDQLSVPNLSASDSSNPSGSQAGSLPMLRESNAWSQDSSDQDHSRHHHDWYTDLFYSRVNNSFTDSPTSTRL